MPKASKKTSAAPPVLIAVQSLGCAKNLVDTEVMCGLLASNGYIITSELEEATIFLINTCGFIQSARDEAYGAIRDAIKWKRAGIKAGVVRKIVVAGCLSQRFPEQCAKDFPPIDRLMGLDDVPKVVDIVKELLASASPEKPVSRIDSAAAVTYIYDDVTPRLLCTPESYAYVKLAEGCNHRCAFCAIPGIRGNLRSRPLDSVLTECRQLLERGIKEIDLIAQDSTAYGVDQNDPGRLAELLRRLDALDGDFWIRVLYTHPLHLTDDFIDLLADSPNGHIVPYLDVPLQHIANHLLASMRRGMTEAQTRERMESIRRKHPDLIIRTTFMTGYPGETEADSQALLDFVKAFGFDRMGAFAFSPEAGTPAGAMTEGIVPHRTASQRLSKLMKLQQSISRQRNRRLVGKRIRVLVEDELEDGTFIGRSAADAPDVDQAVHILPAKDGRLPALNDFAEAEITSASEYDLMGILV